MTSPDQPQLSVLLAVNERGELIIPRISNDRPVIALNSNRSVDYLQYYYVEHGYEGFIQPILQQPHHDKP